MLTEIRMHSWRTSDGIHRFLENIAKEFCGEINQKFVRIFRQRLKDIYWEIILEFRSEILPVNYNELSPIFSAFSIRISSIISQFC